MSPTKQPITPEVVKRIRALHKQHPKLGQNGLSKLLAAEGIHLDPHELRAFLAKKGMSQGPTSRWVESGGPLKYGYPGGDSNL